MEYDQEPQDGQGEKEETVPVSVVQALRKELQEAKAARDQAHDHAMLYRTALETKEYAAKHGEAPQTETDEDDDEPMTKGEFKRKLSAEKNAFTAAIANIHAALEKNDFQTVIKEKLPKVLQSNPEMLDILKSLPPHLQSRVAYYFGKTHAEENKEEPKTTGNAAKPKPISPSAIGGSAAISAASKYASMSDEDLEKELARVLAQPSTRR